MQASPAPQPEPEPGASPAPASAPEGRRGQPYVPKPDFDGPRRPRRRLAALLALAFAGLLGGAWLLAPSSPPPGGAPVEARQERVFQVAAGDLDMEVTRRARRQLEAGQVPPELAGAPQAVRDAVREGRMSLYTLRLLDFVEEDGDAVTVAVDGASLGEVALSHAGARLTVPLAPGQSHALTVTAVRDGGGGVTFGAQSSAGQMLTRVMGVADSETWTVAFKR